MNFPVRHQKIKYPWYLLIIVFSLRSQGYCQTCDQKKCMPSTLFLYLLSFEVTCEKVQLSLADLASGRARDTEEPRPAKIPRTYVCFKLSASVYFLFNFLSSLVLQTLAIMSRLLMGDIVCCYLLQNFV